MNTTYVIRAGSAAEVEECVALALLATREHAAANARNTASIELHERFGFEEITRRFSFPGLTFKGGEGILFRLRLNEKSGRFALRAHSDRFRECASRDGCAPSGRGAA